MEQDVDGLLTELSEALDGSHDEGNLSVFLDAQLPSCTLHTQHVKVTDDIDSLLADVCLNSETGPGCSLVQGASDMAT